tara:strand:- start:307 stop:624 length:318 start_codon:yes stop_codon:yes gene_type:complete
MGQTQMMLDLQLEHQVVLVVEEEHSSIHLQQPNMLMVELAIEKLEQEQQHQHKVMMVDHPQQLMDHIELVVVVALEVLVLLEALILELVDLVFSCQQHSKIQYPQ